MRTSGIRFWAVEHLLGMVIAIALAHVGKSRIRKAATDARRHRLALIFFGLALLAVLVSIPWPAMPNGRPLFRW
jgi:predicted membrane channel-forming protein YqfA (hemolysin III family)